MRDPKVRDFTPFAGTHTSGLALRAAARPVSHCINAVSIGRLVYEWGMCCMYHHICMCISSGSSYPLVLSVACVMLDCSWDVVWEGAGDHFIV